MRRVLEKAGYTPGTQIALAPDCAASEFSAPLTYLALPGRSCSFRLWCLSPP